MTNLREEYLNLLELQYWKQPNARTEIISYTDEIQTIADFIRAFEREIDIDTAYGHRLDLIGKIVGISRIIGVSEREYFAFAGTVNGGTFGTAPFYDLFRDASLALTELNDTKYRFFIRAKIAKNTASAVMVNGDSDKLSLQQAIRFMFQDQAFIVNNLNMTLTLFVDERFSSADIDILFREDLVPTPQGVGLIVVQYSEEGTFGFSNLFSPGTEDPALRTFGSGIFATIIR